MCERGVQRTPNLGKLSAPPLFVQAVSILLIVRYALLGSGGTSSVFAFNFLLRVIDFV